MAVVEYMLEKRDATNQRWIPGWVSDTGHWPDSETHTYIGWVDDLRDYYVPDTVLFLSKEDLVQRQLNLHRKQPMCEMIHENGIFIIDPSKPLSEEQVRTMIEQWYDEFVLRNS
jgi:hypothetical protein